MLGYWSCRTYWKENPKRYPWTSGISRCRDLSNALFFEFGHSLHPEFIPCISDTQFVHLEPLNMDTFELSFFFSKFSNATDVQYTGALHRQVGVPLMSGVNSGCKQWANSKFWVNSIPEELWRALHISHIGLDSFTIVFIVDHVWSEQITYIKNLGN